MIEYLQDLNQWNHRRPQYDLDTYQSSQGITCETKINMQIYFKCI